MLKKIIIIQLFVLLFAKVSVGYDDFYQDIDLPEYFGNETSVQALIDSLGSASEISRVYAAVRLGEIEDASSVSALKTAFENEPAHNRFDYGFSVKYYCLVSIGRIGGLEAENTLEDIASKYLVDDVLWKNKSLYGDRNEIISGLFESMILTGDPEYSGLFLEISENVDYQFYVREEAYVSYLRINLGNSIFNSYSDSMKYLLDEKMQFYTTSRINENGDISLDYVKDSAFESLIIKYGQEDPGILDLYISDLPFGDPYAEEVEKLKIAVQNMIDYWKSRKASH